MSTRINKLKLSPLEQNKLVELELSPVKKNSLINDLSKSFVARKILNTQKNLNKSLIEKQPKINTSIQLSFKKSVSVRATPANTFAFFDESTIKNNIKNKKINKHLKKQSYV